MRVAILSESNSGKGASCPTTLSKMEYLSKLISENNIERVYSLAEADSVVYSSCVFDDKSLNDSIKTICRLITLKRIGNLKDIYVAGCVAKIPELKDTIKSLDIHFIDDPNWPNIIINQMLGKENIISSEDNIASNIHSFAQDNDVYISMDIVNGCTNKCSFCKVNYMDSHVVSLPYNELLLYLKNKIKNGTKIIEFHAQSLNLYGIDLYGKPILHKLLHELAKEDGLVYLLLGEITPQNMYPELLEEIKNNPKIKNVTLQLESASNPVLKNMNRNYTIEKYDDIASSIINSGKIVDTILMTGFPLETYEDLDRTIEYINKRRIIVSGICQYIDSPNIPSHVFPQYSFSEKTKHSKYLKRSIDKINIEIMNENMPRLTNGIVFRKENDFILASVGSTKFAFSNKEKYKELELGSIIEDAPKQYVKKSKLLYNASIYKY